MTRHRLAVLLMLAAGVGMAPVLPAHAQALPSDDNPDAVAETDASESTDADVRELELDWSQLNVDASTLPPGPAAKARLPKAAGGTDMSWTAKDKSNGAAAVSVKQPLLPFWDARIGADMTVVDQPQTLTSADLLRQKFSSDGQPSQSSGTAWAAITAPGVGSIWDKTAIEARIDPSQEQGKLGTSLTKSLPLGEQYLLTLQNGYNVIQQGIVPVPGIAAHPVRNYETEQSAKLSIADTGTSLTAGQSLSSTEDKWLRKIGAEQKLFGGVTINGSIGETALGTTNKSLTAGFKRSW
ncbi:hypothetical protein KMZ29_22265 [Bradyrhizobium sediminis]|uniref:Uncharacterized protein n=1 Tax=Bradyrhizobium sediminis TaxID=2840469 RepID=A0A975RM69_9BRAD|nr:hypothetical protein [Bradyrhizobium sediminis]QWG12403.1 hypothetical protein KMZ29_22265 [Bradyrhizobium sediminis]